MQKSEDSMRELLQDPTVSSWRTVMQAYRSIFTQLERHLLERGYTMSRFQIMFCLYYDGPMAPYQIADRLLVTRGNVSTFLQRMRADGLVKSAAGLTQNRPFVTLSRKGRRDFEALFPQHVERIHELMEPFDQDVLLALQALVEAKDQD